MQAPKADAMTGRVDVENVGGIRETSVEFSPGVTLLVGRNATNRTSFLQAVMAVLGSDDASIRGSADEATVELTLEDTTYTRRLYRGSDGIRTEGEPYLDDATLADQFAFLLESNEARRAVAGGADLRDLIMRPVDTDEIQATIEQLVQERRSLEEELDEIEELKDNLPQLEDRRTQLRSDIEETKSELEQVEAELESVDAEVETSREEQSEMDAKLDQLGSKRTELDDVRYDIETERESLEALQQERSELETERDALPEISDDELDELEAEISRLRQQQSTLETEATEIQTVIAFNEERLDDAETSPFDVLSDGNANVTDQLLDDVAVTCWTCGSEVERTQVESTIDRLRELYRSKMSRIEEVETELDELHTRTQDLKEARRQRERIEERLADIEPEIEESKATIERLQDERADMEADIETIETEIEALEDDSHSHVLELHKEANELEYELGTLENEYDRIESNIAELEDRIAEQDDLEAELDAINSEIDDLRTKIERLEREAIDQFNEHMETILDLLDYDNIDRIWLERVEKEVREGRRKVTKSTFDLHVVRQTASGTAYEDTVAHLSESEREVTGLIFALAGFLAHRVYEDVPFMLLDSLEAIDSDRIAALVEYLEQFSEYLMIAVLAGDAAELPDTYDRITSI